MNDQPEGICKKGWCFASDAFGRRSGSLFRRTTRTRRVSGSSSGFASMSKVLNAHLEAVADKLFGERRSLDVVRQGRSHPLGAELFLSSPAMSAKTPRKGSEAGPRTRLEHRPHETFPLPRSRTSEHFDTNTTEAPDVGFRRIALLVVVDHCTDRAIESVPAVPGYERSAHLRVPSRRWTLA